MYTSYVDELRVAFSSRLPAEMCATLDNAALERELVELVARAREQAVGVELDPVGFVGYVAERVTFDVADPLAEAAF